MTKQINLKMPEQLFSSAQKYVENFGFRNVQELALESIRQKVYEGGEYDEELTEKEIELIDRIITTSIKRKSLGTAKDLSDALR